MSRFDTEPFEKSKRYKVLSLLMDIVYNLQKISLVRGFRTFKTERNSYAIRFMKKNAVFCFKNTSEWSQHVEEEQKIDTFNVFVEVLWSCWHISKFTMLKSSTVIAVDLQLIFEEKFAVFCLSQSLNLPEKTKILKFSFFWQF